MPGHCPDWLSPQWGDSRPAAGMSLKKERGGGGRMAEMSGIELSAPFAHSRERVSDLLCIGELVHAF